MSWVAESLGQLLMQSGVPEGTWSSVKEATLLIGWCVQPSRAIRKHYVRGVCKTTPQGVSGRGGVVPALKSHPESRLPRFRSLLCLRGSKPTDPTSFWSSLIFVLWAALGWQLPPPFLLKLCPPKVLTKASWPFPSPIPSANTRSCLVHVFPVVGWPYPTVMEVMVKVGLSKQGASLWLKASVRWCVMAAWHIHFGQKKTLFTSSTILEGVLQASFLHWKACETNGTSSPPQVSKD